MTLSNEVQQLIARAKDPARGLTTERQERIELYANGLRAKLRQAEYGLEKIRQLVVNTPTGSSPGQFSDIDSIHFYSDSFWAFARATLDVLAQLINQTEGLALNERQCDFNNMQQEISSRYPVENITTIVTALSSLQTIIELHAYRNCSLHRRQVYLENRVYRREYSTPGYTSSTGLIYSNEWYLCENPLDVHPNTTGNRVITIYCSTMIQDIITQLHILLPTLIP